MRQNFSRYARLRQLALVSATGLTLILATSPSYALPLPLPPSNADGGNGGDAFLGEEGGAGGEFGSSGGNGAGDANGAGGGGGGAQDSASVNGTSGGDGGNGGGDSGQGGFGAGDRPAYLEFETFNITDNNLRIGEFYAMAWGGVNRANQVLDNVSLMEVDGDFTEALKTRLLGEATFLRALHYTNLVLGFGGMPIYTSVPTIDAEVLPRATAEDCWTFIIEDFNNAASMLPDSYDAANMGRATKGTARQDMI